MKAVSRLLTLALSALLLVPSVLSCVLPTVAADDAAETYTGGTPVYLVDFTDPTDNAGFSNLSALQTLSEDGYVSFRATANDPCTFLRQPTCAVADVHYAVIEYRTTVTDLLGQFYAGFVPGPGLSEATCITWDWNGNGEWNKKIVDISKYSETGADAFGGLRFDPLQQNNGKVVTDGDTLDVKCIAFFATEEEAEAFTIEAYKQHLADQEQEEEDKKEEDEDAVRNSWKQPEYKDIDATALDNQPGTLKLTPSEDGATVTVSYTLNGEEKNYTVPNSNQYTSGPLAGVDDLGRSLYNQYSQAEIHSTLPTYPVNAYGENGEHYVGIFYFLWMGEHGDYGILDMEKIIAEAGEDKAGSTLTANWGPINAMHHFAEPLFGYYYSSDEWVIRKHMELLSNAGVDFLYFDTTNARTYMHNVKKIMQVCHEMNEQGFDAPQFCFYTRTNAHAVVREVYNEIYSKNLYPDTWFMVGGKPVIMAPTDANINDFFNVKQDQWPNEAIKDNCWPWLDLSWNQTVHDNVDGTIVAVSVAQQAGAGYFSASRLYGERNNRGRSYDGYWTKKDGVYTYRSSGSYRQLDKDPENSYKYGYNFQSQFSVAYMADAKYIMITGWNEWVAERQVHNFSGIPLPEDGVVFVDTCGVEFSRDIEMTRGYYFDNYYMQLVRNIQALKGAAPTLPQDMRKTINITGAFDQWDDIPVTYHDVAGDAADRDSLSFGQVRLTDESGRNDIVASKMTLDKENLYIYIETANAIRKPVGDSTWMNVYLNTDNAQTGWYGYDYIINYKYVDDFTTKVAKCNTTDGSYGFEAVGDASIHVDDNKMMISVPLSTLGIANYKEVYLTFKVADSDTKLTTMEQFYTEGDVAPLGRTNFVYQNYIPGVSEPQPLPETEPVTEPITDPTDPTTEAPTTPVESETPASADTDRPADQGCGSTISGLAAVTAATVAAGVALSKRERRRNREN